MNKRGGSYSIFTLLLGLTLVVSGCTGGGSQSIEPSRPQYGSILGKVVNETGYRVNNAAVTIPSLGLSTTSSSDGTFSLPNIPAGEYTLQISRESLHTQAFPVLVAANQSVTDTYKLQFVIPNDPSPYAVKLYNSSVYTFTSGGVTLRPGDNTTLSLAPGRYRALVSVSGFGTTERTMVVYKNPTYIHFVYMGGVHYFETH